MRNSIRNLIPYEPGLPIEALEERIGRPIIRLSANESLWGPSPSVHNILQDAVGSLKYYPDGAARRLKEALAALWGVPTGNLCIGNGSDEIIFMLAAALLNPGDEALIPLPTFSEYAAAVNVTGGKTVFVQQPSLRFNLEEIANKATARTKIIFLCNPNNPTGTFFTHSELQAFLDKIAGNIPVVLDEAYCHYADDPEFPRSGELLREYNNLIVLRTFSKVYGLAALRIGYAAADTAIIADLEKVRMPFNVNALAQRAALAALHDEKHVREVVAATIAERAWLTEKLSELRLKVLPSQANFILTHVGNGAMVAEKLLAEGLQVRDTASFNLPEWLRITIGPRQAMEKLVAALRAVLNV